MAKRKGRNFTPEFKAKVVLETLRGETSQVELCRRHNLSEDKVSTWKRQLLENAASLFESRDKSSKGYRANRSTRATRWTVDRGSGHPRKSLDFVERKDGSERARRKGFT